MIDLLVIMNRSLCRISVQTDVNIGAALVSGVDVQLNYRLDLPPGFGDVAFEMNGSYLQHNESTPYVGAHTYDCAGLFGFTCQTINPRWHHIFRTTCKHRPNTEQLENGP